MRDSYIRGGVCFPFQAHATRNRSGPLPLRSSRANVEQSSTTPHTYHTLCSHSSTDAKKGTNYDVKNTRFVTSRFNPSVPRTRFAATTTACTHAPLNCTLSTTTSISSDSQYESHNCHRLQCHHQPSPSPTIPSAGGNSAATIASTQNHLHGLRHDPHHREDPAVLASAGLQVDVSRSGH